MCEFDSDLDVTEVSNDIADDGIEFLDTSSGDADISCQIEQLDTDDNIGNEDLTDDNYYHASRMSEEEVSRIEDMWNDTSENSDVEPYHATPLSDIEQQSEIVEPYKATRISDSSDIPEEAMDQIDSTDMETESSLEEQFAKDLEEMSLKDMDQEQLRLEALGKLSDDELFSEYDKNSESNYDHALFESLTNGLSRESLEQLKEGLANGDPTVYEYFGLTGNDENSDNSAPTLSRRR